MAGSNNKTTVGNGTQKRDKKRKGKDAALEALTQSLKPLNVEEQISTLINKYAELVDDNKHLQATAGVHEKTIQQIMKEKDKVDQDYTKAVLSRSKLESLCRELQRQMKTLKDENVLRLKEEEEKRREISNQFNTTLNEITRLMEENTVKNNKLRDENNNMADRLKALIDHNDKREDHVDKVIKQKEIENQLSLAKMAKYQYEFTEQKGTLLGEKKQLLEEVSRYQQKMTVMAGNELQLRNQLASYSSKYEEFQSTLDKSNKLFNNFKTEMDTMTKTIKRHEKETKNWRDKWENANKALLQMVTERSTMEAKLDAQARQNTRLQSLCRALQQQLTESREQNKGGKVEPSNTTTSSNSSMATDCAKTMSELSINSRTCHPCPLDYKSDQFDTASEDEFHPAEQATPEKKDGNREKTGNDQGKTGNDHGKTACLSEGCMDSTPVEDPVGDKVNCEELNEEKLDMKAVD